MPESPNDSEMSEVGEQDARGRDETLCGVAQRYPTLEFPTCRSLQSLV